MSKDNLFDIPYTQSLEILIHCLDKDGNRLDCFALNRIQIPLQVESINEEESVMLISALELAIGSAFLHNPMIHRLIQLPQDMEQEDSERSIADIVQSLLYRVCYDHIEIPNSQQCVPLSDSSLDTCKQ